MELRKFFNMFSFGEQRALPTQIPPEDPTLAGGSVLSWLSSGTQGALNVSTFFRGVTLTSNAVAQLPIYVKKIEGHGVTNVIRDHPAYLLFNDDGNLVDQVTLMRTIVQNVICKGNAFVYIERGADGTPVRLRYLQSGDVTVNFTKEKNTLYYTSSILGSKKISPKDMLHFKLFTWDGVNGVSVLHFAKFQTELANTTNEQAKEFFEKGCNQISGVVTVASNLNEAQRKQILNTWNQTYSSSKAGLTVLQGNMTYTPLSINPDDAQLLESREFNQADICQFLNINPAQLGLKGYNGFKSFEDANNELLQRTLMPYITMIEKELSRKLLNDNTLKIILDTAAFLRPNKQAEAQYYSTLIDKGVLTRNEVREILGYNKLDGLDEIVIPYTDIKQNTIGGETNNDNNSDDNGEGNQEISGGSEE